MSNLRQLMDQYERGQLSFDQLALGMESIRLTQKPFGRTLAEDYEIAEGPRDDNDLFWLDSALNRDVITAEQHQHLIHNSQRASP